ncbi:MAG: rod shape-determining protein MreD [Chloroflexi bacterium]|nr:rod shape-determining protein MreD [Chloroflexota bacterium]MBV9597527.1 rod shape-determining protein MreD [Chloroflexota bacterium]
MRFLVVGALLAFAALLQSVLGPSLPLVRGRPDLVLVVVLAWAMLRGSGEGALVGFLGGMLLDSVTYTPFGINTALFGLIGYCAGLPEVNVYRGNLPYFLGITALATLAYHTVYFLILQALGNSMPPLIETYAAAVPAAALNALLVPLAFVVCRRLVRTLAGWSQMRL